MASPSPTAKRPFAAALLSSSCALLATFAPTTAAGVGKSAKEEAAAISQVASAKHQAGEFGLCAELFHQAYDKDPTYLAYVFSAARCLHKKGDLDAAERDYRQFLARSPRGAPLVDKAQEFLDQLLEERARLAAEAKKAAAATPVPTVVQPVVVPAEVTPAAVAHSEPPAPVRAPLTTVQWAGWGLAATGLASVIAGGYLLSLGQADKAELEAALQHPKTALIVAITPAEARARDEAWRGSMRAGFLAAGLGMAALGGGLILALKTPAQVSLGVDGIQIAWHWR